ncbi:hypothetical protein NMY22_g2068 [Coprinellus aureogranulatus]|nr:hypothetical protein NMY22_g2068 [Coprinellus aureogranulatus]
MRPGYAFKVDTPSIADDMHPVIHAGRVAVITGAASGIGRAAAVEFARLKLKVAIADVNEAELRIVGKELAELTGESNVLIIPTDVSKLDQVVALKEKVYEAWGEVSGRLLSFFHVGRTDGGLG